MERTFDLEVQCGIRTAAVPVDFVLCSGPFTIGTLAPSKHAGFDAIGLNVKPSDDDSLKKIQHI